MARPCHSNGEQPTLADSAHRLLSVEKCFYLTHIVEETIMQRQLVQAFRHIWRNVLPVGAPGCSQGTPYSFWVREGDPTKLAVILSGGGACWTGENCALHGKPFYRPFAGLEKRGAHEPA